MSDYAETLHLLSLLPAPQHTSGIRRADVLALSLQLGIRFPRSLVDWLTQINGASVDSQFLVGISGDGGINMQEIYAIHPAWKRAGFIPVAGDGCGNLYVIATRNEYGDSFPVLFIDHKESDTRPSYIVASDFQIFVQEFIKKEALRSQVWPFNEEAVLKIDPEITRFTDVLLPWSVE